MSREIILCDGGLQGSFDHRMKAWQRWQDAQAVLQKKRETEAKLLWANKPDKLQLAKEEIVEVQRHQNQQCKSSFSPFLNDWASIILDSWSFGYSGRPR